MNDIMFLGQWTTPLKLITVITLFLSLFILAVIWITKRIKNYDKKHKINEYLKKHEIQ